MDFAAESPQKHALVLTRPWLLMRALHQYLGQDHFPSYIEAEKCPDCTHYCLIPLVFVKAGEWHEWTMALVTPADMPACRGLGCSQPSVHT